MMYSKTLKKNNKLIALTSAAMAIPMLGDTASAKGVVDDSRFSYRFSSYTESTVVEGLGEYDNTTGSPGSTSDDGSIKRGEVGLHQFQLLLPFSSNVQVDLDVKTEITSGATGIYLKPGTGGDNDQPIMVLTSENIDDQRTEISGTGSYFMDDISLTVNAGVSSEEDYFALSFGGSASMELNNDNTVVSAGLGYTSVDVEPVRDFFNQFNGSTPPSTPIEDADGNPLSKTQISLFSDVSHVFTANIIAKLGLGLNLEDGYLSDPYKRVYVTGVQGNLVADNRPDSRTQVSLYTNYRQFINAANGAFHLDYRLHFDNWRMASHTFEASWYQGIDDFLRMFDGGALSSKMGDSWDMSVSARYYVQGKAFFYQHYYDDIPTDGYLTSDYRLSDFGAFSFALRAERQFTNWKLFAGFENYYSALSLAFSSEEEFENPGLVDWLQFSVGVELKFR